MWTKASSSQPITFYLVNEIKYVPVLVVGVDEYILNRMNEDMVEFWGWYTAPNIHYMLVVHQASLELEKTAQPSS